MCNLVGLGAPMGFLAFCLMFGFVVITIWGAIKSKDERAKLVAEFNEAPMKMIFVTVWILAAFMFFFGIFIPVLGEKEFFDTGLKIWQLGLLWGLGRNLVCETLKAIPARKGSAFPC